MFCFLEMAQQSEHYPRRLSQKENLLTMKAEGFAVPRVSCVCATEVLPIHLHICRASCPQVFAISRQWHLFHGTGCVCVCLFLFILSKMQTSRTAARPLCLSLCSHESSLSECDQRIWLLPSKANILEKDISGNVNCPHKESLHV